MEWARRWRKRMRATPCLPSVIPWIEHIETARTDIGDVPCDDDEAVNKAVAVSKSFCSSMRCTPVSSSCRLLTVRNTTAASTCSV